MNQIESAQVVPAVLPHVRGLTLEVTSRAQACIPGATPAGFDAQSGYPQLAGWRDASLDTVVAIEGFGGAVDPLACLREWRRVLREGGQLLVVLASEPAPGARHTLTPAYLRRLCDVVGGFEGSAVSPIPGCAGQLWRARRAAIAEVRNPLASVGAAVAAAAQASPRCRSELSFQLGAILLQSGDAALASSFFSEVIEAEPESPEAHFGLGMCYGSQQRWREAEAELQRALQLDPSNGEAKRWLELARRSTSRPASILPAAGERAPIADRFSPAGPATQPATAAPARRAPGTLRV
jgi:hypothetical protein